MSYEELIQWSNAHFHELPWRRNRTVYRTWISEVMLQQTTVATVQKRFENFFESFPDLAALARASEEELLLAWKGLGYYRRAKNLGRAAREMQERFGRIPDNYDDLISIKGIGEYTASAILSMGYGQPFLTLDTNLQRVLARLYGLELPKGPKLQRKIQQLHEKNELFPAIDDYRALNEALMDLGRTLCQSRKTNCLACPLQDICFAYRENLQTNLPIIERRKNQRFEVSLVRYWLEKNGKILVYQKAPHEWLSGQWELPTFILQSEDPHLRQYEYLAHPPAQSPLVELRSSITKYKIRNQLHLIDSEENIRKISERNYQWISFDELEKLSSTCQKLAKKYLSQRKKSS